MEKESRKEEIKLAIEYGIVSKLKHNSYKSKLIDIITNDPYNLDNDEPLYTYRDLVKKSEVQLEDILLELFQMFKNDYGGKL